MVRQLDIFIHPQPAKRPAYPLLMIVQHAAVPAQMGEVLVVPLASPLRSAGDRLLLVFEVNGQRVQLLTPLMRRIPVKRPADPVANLGMQRARIIAAIDFLFAGS